jgi:hypothetical protein
MSGKIDSSLQFGGQNFFYTNDYIGSSVSGDDNEYVFYQNRKGTILIAKFASDGSSGRYISFPSTSVYATVVAARGSYTYVLPSEVVDQQF